MRLLVSVRDAGEAAVAVAEGADIIDAKEPLLGPLAPVSPVVLESICAAVALSRPLSVALGDARPQALAGLVAGVASLRRRQLLFFKCAVVAACPEEALGGIRAACRVMQSRADRPALVVARYVDEPSDARDLPRWLEVCAVAGARGLLLDTSRKDGPGLLGSVNAGELAALRRHAARRGLWLAVAGGVTIAAMEALSVIRPHVVGIRGAACDGGRTGTLSAPRLAQLQRALAALTPRPRSPALPV